LRLNISRPRRLIQPNKVSKIASRTLAGNSQYSYSGRATQYTDENGVTRISQVDGLGRTKIVCEISSNGNMPGSGSPVSCGTDIPGTGFTTNYSYTLASPTTTVTQGPQTRTFSTDWLGRTTSVQEPESGLTTYGYSYNSTGLVVTRQRPQANQTSASTLTTTTTQYDSLGRVLTVSYSDGTPTKNFTYDKTVSWPGLTQNNLIGRMASAAVSNAATIFGYDAMGRTTDLDECLPSGCGNSAYNRLLHSTYDLAGNLTSSTDGGAATSTYSISPANEILSLTSSINDANDPANLVSNVQNGPNGPISYNLGNGLATTYSYDALGRLNSGKVALQGSPSYCYVFHGYRFTDAWKGVRLTSSSDTVLNQSSTYGYDEFNRLTALTVNAGAVQNYTWTYDRFGNRLTQTALQGGLSTSVGVNTSTNQLVGYTYDAAGNMINDGLHSYSYDAEGNLVSVDSGQTAQYVYNALNQRVRTVVGNTITEFVFNASGQRASVWNGTTHAQIRGQYYLGGKPVAFYASGAAHFQHQDWLGTERLRTDHAGNAEGTFKSLPFGDNQTTASGSDLDPFHFASLDYDAETNTHHAQFRQYYSSQGRWTSPDPYTGSYDMNNPQSFNRYAYVMNNPLSFIDPFGLVLCDYGDGDNEDADTPDECTSNGGSLVVDTTTVTVDGSDPNDPGITTENGTQIYPVNIPGNAPNNGNNCSVLDPNCNKPGPVQKYVNFLGCEANDTMQTLDDQDPLGKFLLVNGAFQARWAVKFLNVGLKVKGVNLLSMALAAGYLDMLSVHANQACTKQIYGSN
jgi:RHS repeat-associated protein